MAALSAVLNVLMLTGSFYMLQVYDRAIPSRSVPTLIALSLIAVLLYAFQGIMEIMRSRILLLLGEWLDESLSGRAFRIVLELPLVSRRTDVNPVRDLETIRGFLISAGPSAFCDTIWIPFYLAICFMFHVYIGLAATLGAVILMLLTILTEMLSRTPAKTATEFGLKRLLVTEFGPPQCGSHSRDGHDRRDRGGLG